MKMGTKILQIDLPVSPTSGRLISVNLWF